MTGPPVDIDAEVKNLKAQGAPDEAIHAYLTQRFGAPIEASDPNAALHKEFKEGRLAKRMASENAVDTAEASDAAGSPAVRAGVATASNFLRGIPGGEATEAGVRSLFRRQPYTEALSDLRNETGNLPLGANIIEQGIGGASLLGPLARVGKGAMALANGSKLAGGAAVGATAAGAARAAKADPESLLDRLGGTVEDAGIGAGVGIAAPWLAGNTAARTAIGAGAGAVLAPEGHRLQGAGVGAGLAFSPSTTTGLFKRLANTFGADKAASLLEELSQATGTKGAVNEQMEGIDRIRKPLGGSVGEGSTASEELADKLAAGRAKTGPLFRKASADAANLEAAPGRAASRLSEMNAVADRPALPAPGQSEISRAEALKGFANHDFTNGPAPTLEEAAARDFTAPVQPGEPFRDNGLMQRDFTAERPVKLRAANDMNVRATETAPAIEPSSGPVDRLKVAQDATDQALQNPFVQTRLKAPEYRGRDPESYEAMHDLYRDLNQEYGKIKSAGQDFGPHWDQLNAARGDLKDALLAKAPSLADANAVHALDVGTPQTWFKKGFGATAKPGANGLLTKSPRALLDAAAQGSNADIVARQGEELQAGARAKLGQDVAAIPLDRGIRGVLRSPAMALSGPAAEQRGLALGGDAGDFEDALAKLRSAHTPSEPGYISRIISAATKGHVNLGGDPALKSLASPQGQRILSNIIKDPQDYQSVLRKFGKGNETLSTLELLSQALGGSLAGRP